MKFYFIFYKDENKIGVIFQTDQNNIWRKMEEA